MKRDKDHSLDPGFSTSRTICVIPDLYPRKAVNLGSFVGSSLGKAFTVEMQIRIPYQNKKETQKEYIYHL